MIEPTLFDLETEASEKRQTSIRDFYRRRIRPPPSNKNSTAVNILLDKIKQKKDDQDWSKRKEVKKSYSIKDILNSDQETTLSPYVTEADTNEENDDEIYRVSSTTELNNIEEITDENDFATTPTSSTLEPRTFKSFPKFEPKSWSTKSSTENTISHKPVTEASAEILEISSSSSRSELENTAAEVHDLIGEDQHHLVQVEITTVTENLPSQEDGVEIIYPSAEIATEISTVGEIYTTSSSPNPFNTVQVNNNNNQVYTSNSTPSPVNKNLLVKTVKNDQLYTTSASPRTVESDQPVNTANVNSVLFTSKQVPASEYEHNNPVNFNIGSQQISTTLSVNKNLVNSNLNVKNEEASFVESNYNKDVVTFVPSHQNKDSIFKTSYPNGYVTTSTTITVTPNVTASQSTFNSPQPVAESTSSLNKNTSSQAFLSNPGDLPKQPRFTRKTSDKVTKKLEYSKTDELESNREENNVLPGQEWKYLDDEIIKAIEEVLDVDIPVDSKLLYRDSSPRITRNNNQAFNNFQSPQDEDLPKRPYSFSYNVFDENTHLSHSRKEAGDANGFVQGEYTVQELNENGECTVRFVAYTASKEDGFDVVETNRRPCSESSSGNLLGNGDAVNVISTDRNRVKVGERPGVLKTDLRNSNNLRPQTSLRPSTVTVLPKRYGIQTDSESSEKANKLGFRIGAKVRRVKGQPRKKLGRRNKSFKSPRSRVRTKKVRRYRARQSVNQGGQQRLKSVFNRQNAGNIISNEGLQNQEGHPNLLNENQNNIGSSTYQEGQLGNINQGAQNSIGTESQQGIVDQPYSALPVYALPQSPQVNYVEDVSVENIAANYDAPNQFPGNYNPITTPRPEVIQSTYEASLEAGNVQDSYLPGYTTPAPPQNVYPSQGTLTHEPQPGLSSISHPIHGNENPSSSNFGNSNVNPMNTFLSKDPLAYSSNNNVDPNFIHQSNVPNQHTVTNYGASDTYDSPNFLGNSLPGSSYSSQGSTIHSNPSSLPHDISHHNPEQNNLPYQPGQSPVPPIGTFQSQIHDTHVKKVEPHRPLVSASPLPIANHNVDSIAPPTGYGVPLGSVVTSKNLQPEPSYGSISSVSSSSSYNSPSISTDDNPGTISNSYHAPNGNTHESTAPSTGYGVPLGNVVSSENTKPGVFYSSTPVSSSSSSYDPPRPAVGNFPQTGSIGNSYDAPDVHSNSHKIIAPSNDFGIPLEGVVTSDNDKQGYDVPTPSIGTYKSEISAPSTGYGVPLDSIIASNNVNPAEYSPTPVVSSGSSYNAPKPATSYKIESPIEAYGAPHGDVINSQPINTDSISSYGAPQGNVIDSIFTYGAPVVNVISNTNHQISSSNTPFVEPVTTNIQQNDFGHRNNQYDVTSNTGFGSFNAPPLGDPHSSNSFASPVAIDPAQINPSTLFGFAIPQPSTLNASSHRKRFRERRPITHKKPTLAPNALDKTSYDPFNYEDVRRRRKETRNSDSRHSRAELRSLEEDDQIADTSSQIEVQSGSFVVSGRKARPKKSVRRNMLMNIVLRPGGGDIERALPRPRVDVKSAGKNVIVIRMTFPDNENIQGLRAFSPSDDELEDDLQVAGSELSSTARQHEVIRVRAPRVKRVKKETEEEEIQREIERQQAEANFGKKIIPNQSNSHPSAQTPKLDMFTQDEAITNQNTNPGSKPRIPSADLRKHLPKHPPLQLQPHLQGLTGVSPQLVSRPPFAASPPLPPLPATVSKFLEDTKNTDWREQQQKLQKQQQKLQQQQKQQQRTRQRRNNRAKKKPLRNRRSRMARVGNFLRLFSF